MSVYTALVWRAERFWHIEVSDIARVTQARSFKEVDLIARDLIAIMSGAEPDAFELDIRVQLRDSGRAPHRKWSGRRESNPRS